MFRPQPGSIASRRGIILLVVVSMLTLFAIIGISFVLYAQAEATAARVYREVEQPPEPDVEAQLLLAYYLEQLIYGPDSTKNPYSALRGHDLLRNQYGFNKSLSSNVRPFNGPGRLRATNDYVEVNYQDRSQVGGGPRRDPEMYKGRFVSWNAPYTYPDHNNMFLAAVKADGTVLVPSWRRPWTENSSDWTTSLRPSAADNPQFPAMEDGGGDVKNLAASPGYWDGHNYHANDSIWIDLGFPVQSKRRPRRRPLQEAGSVPSTSPMA